MAGRYLDDADLMGFIEEMRAAILTCIGNTHPEDQRTRDSLYYQHLGLVDLVAHLKSYHETAISIHAANELEQEMLVAQSEYGAD